MSMRRKLAVVGLAACLTLTAQAKLTVQQLIEFITSSIKLNQDDGKVAKYLRDVTLSERLDARAAAIKGPKARA